MAAIIRQTGISRRGQAGAIQAERRGQRGERHLVRPHARASGSRRSRATRSARPDDQARLRPAEQLVAAERDEVGAGRQPLARASARGPGRSAAVSSSAPLPEVVDDDRAVRVGERARARAGPGASMNPACAKFDGWTRRTTVARPSASGASKSAARVRFVVPDLDEPRAGPPDDLGDAHAAADLDQLAARHGDAAPAGQAHRERQRRRVVVRDQGVLGAGQRDEVLLGGAEAAARAGRSSRSSSSSE